jgi:hypothetical protein
MDLEKCRPTTLYSIGRCCLSLETMTWDLSWSSWVDLEYRSPFTQPFRAYRGDLLSRSNCWSDGVDQPRCRNYAELRYLCDSSVRFVPTDGFCLPSPLVKCVRNGILIDGRLIRLFHDRLLLPNKISLRLSQGSLRDFTSQCGYGVDTNTNTRWRS